MKIALLLAPTTLLLSDLAAGQGPLQPTSIQPALDPWQASHGTQWDVVVNEITGKARMLLGGQAFLFAPTSEVEEIQLARAFVDEAHALFGVDSSSLMDDRILTLPLAAFGTTDKRTVRFAQGIDGVPIEGRSVNVLFERGTGHLLSIDSTATPNLGNGVGRRKGKAVAAVTPADARTLAAQVFEMATSGTAEELGRPELLYVPVGAAPEETFVLVWAVDVAGQDGAGAEAARRAYLDAGDGSLVRADDRLHEAAPQQAQGPRGRVRAIVTEEGVCCLPGNCCWLHDTGENRIHVDVPHLEVTFGSGHVVVTGPNGLFARPAEASGDATLRFEGPFFRVEDRFSRNTIVTTRLRRNEGIPQAIPMNPSPTEVSLAQANAFYRLNQMRDWVRRVNPDDATADSSSATESVPFRAVVNAPSPPPRPGCNAVYNGQGIKFDASGPNCANSAFATVVWHEMGHWLNDLHHNGNGGDLVFRGFGEGLADVYSMYQLDYERLYYENVALREGTNTLPSCGDCEGDQGCLGGVHRNGLPLMGAFWKMRANLKVVEPATGGDLADALFLGWLNAYDQDRIHSLIEYQLLVLDDDDGDLSTGTPHGAAIDAAFRAHAFVGFDPRVFQRGGHQLTAVRICP